MTILIYTWTKLKKGFAIHHTDLSDCRGENDLIEHPGIYFCSNLNDLYAWIKELFDYVNPSAIELLEITPLDDVRTRTYDDGRLTYTTDSCKARVLNDEELTPDLLSLIYTFFG